MHPLSANLIIFVSLYGVCGKFWVHRLANSLGRRVARLVKCENNRVFIRMIIIPNKMHCSSSSSCILVIFFTVYKILGFGIEIIEDAFMFLFYFVCARVIF